MLRLVTLSLLPVALLSTACSDAHDDVVEGDEVSTEDALRAGVSPGTWRMYVDKNHRVDPGCDHFVRLDLEGAGGGSRATLTDGLAGTCRMHVPPDERAFRLKLVSEECGSKTYSGSRRSGGNVHKLVVTDHRARTCAGSAAEIIAEETKPSERTVTRYSLEYVDNIGCPPVARVYCAPPTTNPYCEERRPWIADNCPGVEFVDR